MICVSPWNRCSYSPKEETKHQLPEIIINNIIIQQMEILPTHNNNNNNFINPLKKAFQLNLQCQISKT